MFPSQARKSNVYTPSIDDFCCAWTAGSDAMDPCSHSASFNSWRRQERHLFRRLPTTASFDALLVAGSLNERAIGDTRSGKVRENFDDAPMACVTCERIGHAKSCSCERVSLFRKSPCKRIAPEHFGACLASRQVFGVADSMPGNNDSGALGCSL
jgi:hypothetical protein